MSVGKRIYLQRNMPDPELVEAFKQIPASNTADVMGRSYAMNPRIKLVSSPKAQMMAGPDGIICIPRKDAASILVEARKFQEADEKKLIAARNGTANRAWVEKSLADKGFEIIDGVYEP